MLVGIGLGIILIVFFGLLIKVFILDFDNFRVRSIVAIVIVLIIMVLLLVIVEWIGSWKCNFEKLDIRDGIVIGLV